MGFTTVNTNEGAGHFPFIPSLLHRILLVTVDNINCLLFFFLKNRVRLGYKNYRNECVLLKLLNKLK